MQELKYFMCMTGRTGILKFVKFMYLGSCIGLRPGFKVHHVKKFIFLGHHRMVMVTYCNHRLSVVR